MNITPMTLAGCFKICLDQRNDSRGFFVKTYHQTTFNQFGISANFIEDFFTFSKKNVLRGMHFQLPPKAINKLVTCITGSVLDVLIDLRNDSPTRFKIEDIKLSANEPCILYLPAGVAHGFISLSEEAIMYYKVDQEYDAALDSGIRWDSIGYSWPQMDFIVSDRDNQLTRLEDFSSPFFMTKEG